MIKRLLHALVSSPTIYGLCQHTIGAGQITQRIANHVPSGYSRVLDIGAGKGYPRRLLPAEAQYIALDNDRAMLASSHLPLTVQADATELPILEGSMDMVLLKQVSHHIADDRLDHLLGEIRRVLRPDGRLLFMDAVRTNRRASNLLWRYDRGSHPRLEPDLMTSLGRHFSVLHRESHVNFHLYVLLLLAPLSSTAPAGSASGRSVTESIE